jgi:hypothetical protein
MEHRQEHHGDHVDNSNILAALQLEEAFAASAVSGGSSR